MMPPCGFFCVGLVWRLTIITRSMTTRFGLVQHAQHLAALALLLAGDHDDGVALANALHYSTSGASEMIFMNFFARSSRATGPKMRVPIGSLSLLMSTAELPSKRM